METNCTEFPYQDFVIQTSGELRVSNFLLWKFAYSELFLSQKLWPDFGKERFKIDRDAMVDKIINVSNMWILIVYFVMEMLL